MISIGGASSRIIPAERNPVERRIWSGVRDLEEAKELMMLLRLRRSVFSGTGGGFGGTSSKDEVLEVADAVRWCWRRRTVSSCVPRCGTSCRHASSGLTMRTCLLGRAETWRSVVDRFRLTSVGVERVAPPAWTLVPRATVDARNLPGELIFWLSGGRGGGAHCGIEAFLDAFADSTIGTAVAGKLDVEPYETNSSGPALYLTPNELLKQSHSRKPQRIARPGPFSSRPCR